MGNMNKYVICHSGHHLTSVTLIFNGLKMGKVSNPILDPEVQLWNEKLKRLRENEKKQLLFQ